MNPLIILPAQNIYPGRLYICVHLMRQQLTYEMTPQSAYISDKIEIIPSGKKAEKRAIIKNYASIAMIF
jgi:hypothetical protein